MRVLTSSFAALLTMIAFGPGVTGQAQGVDSRTNGGIKTGTPTVDGAPAIPPVPASGSGQTFAPAVAPAPAPAPSPAFSPALVEPARSEIRAPGPIQTPAPSVNVGVPGNGNVGAAANPSDNQWRYRWHNNNWWYWTPENRWIYRNGNAWVNYEPAVAAVPAVVNANQPAVGYTPGPYGYTTGYRGYYGPAYQGGYYGPAYQGRYYYGSGGYYVQPGYSLGLGFRRGIGIGW
jgi:hypothetical protein